MRIFGGLGYRVGRHGYVGIGTSRRVGGRRIGSAARRSPAPPQRTMSPQSRVERQLQDAVQVLIDGGYSDQKIAGVCGWSLCATQRYTHFLRFP